MRKRRKLLVLSANIGCGHSAAAAATVKAIQSLDAGIETKVLNSFRYADQRVGRMVEDGYYQLIKSFPKLYGLMYESREHPRSLRGLRNWLSQWFAGNFENLLESYQPDAVVCTHAFPFAVMAYIKSRHKISTPCMGVVTDFAVHPYWLCETHDSYAVAHDDLARHMMARGVQPSQVHITGIPVDLRFSAPTDRNKIREQLRLEPHLPTLLVMGGGSGLGPLTKVVRSLRELKLPSQIVILAGRNEKLYHRLEAELSEEAGGGHRFRVLSYVDNVFDYMHAANLLITKPGGLTSYEALACGLPMVLFAPLPGQESRNARFLTTHHCAVRTSTERSLPTVVAELLDDEARLRAMSEAARQLARPDSASSVARRVLELTPRLREDVQPETSLTRLSLAPSSFPRPPLAYDPSS